MEEKEGRGCCKVRMIEYHNYKTLMGPCLISFSIPLLIPGVVLTVVGSYGNEHTFPTFGGWHISGIVILIIAVSLLLVGIVFKCIFRPFLTPDVAQHLTPRQSVISGHQNLGFVSERETAKRVYKGSDKNDLNTRINHQLHRVVSTHEMREKEKAPDTNEANGAVAQRTNEQRNYSNRHQKLNNKVTHRDSSGERDKTFKEIAEGNESDEYNPESPHKEKRRKKQRSKRTTTTTEETNEDGITTRVTSSVRAEADTQVMTESKREKNPSSLSHEEKTRRRRKKKKRRHLEEPTNDIQRTLSDDEQITKLPDLRIRVPQIPPNVPEYESPQYDDRFDLNTPRPVEEIQHVPFLFKIDPTISDPNINEYREQMRFKKTRKKKIDMPSQDTEEIQMHREDNPDMEQEEQFTHTLPSNIGQSSNLDITDTTLTYEPKSLNDANDVDSQKRKHKSKKSKHAYFLRKRGLESDTHEFPKSEIISDPQCSSEQIRHQESADHDLTFMTEKHDL